MMREGLYSLLAQGLDGVSVGFTELLESPEKSRPRKIVCRGAIYKRHEVAEVFKAGVKACPKEGEKGMSCIA